MLAESGKPQLPSFGRYVQIPFNCDYELSVYPEAPVDFDDVLVSPAQAEMTDAANDKGQFEYDAATQSPGEQHEIVEIPVNIFRATIEIPCKYVCFDLALPTS